jgi:hypothetical protein
MTKCPTCMSRNLITYTITPEPPKLKKGQKPSRPPQETGTICWECRMYYSPGR